MRERRRTARRGFDGKHLRDWLKAVAARNSIESMVVADRQGLLVVGHGKDAEEVAALAPLRRADRGPIEVKETAGPYPVLVCVRDCGKRAETAVHEAAPGVRRILDE